MSTQNKMINTLVAGKETTMNSSVVMTYSQVNQLPQWAFGSLHDTFLSAIWGDYTKWCSSLRFYPFKLEPNPSEYSLFVGVKESDTVRCLGPIPITNEFGFYLGEYHYLNADTFADYEPYTTLEIFLPFYGLAQLKVADVANKYIQFRLYIDFLTGKGQYVVGVSDEHIVCASFPYLIAPTVDDTNVRIIGTYNVQLGYDIPITSDGMSNFIRNTGLTVLKSATSIASSALAETFDHSSSQQTTKTVTTQRNQSTGRQIRTGTKTTTNTRDTNSYEGGSRLGSVVETASNVLGAFHISPSVENVSNPVLATFTCRSVAIIRRKARVQDTITGYGKLYGRPCGKVLKLSDVSGYTEATAIHFEGDLFGQATASELAMLEQAFNDGVIL